MYKLYSLLIFGLLTILGQSSFAQRVGLVLSGGGATGLAHIGVLKALEEANIPIDYIVGTSAGALVAGMYVSGMSPEEIEAYVLSENFLKMANGEVSEEKNFFLKTEEPNASMINVPFTADSIFKKSLPTNFITPTYLDYEMFRVFALAGAVARENFDSLMIPFRCVASDIQHKESVIFNQGYLNKAIRASMTYPFYMNPIRVNGLLMFDGGLYNNFPSDVMYNEFDVDFMIGSNVSGVSKPPKEDDILSQIRNMMVIPSNFELPCVAGVMIEPEVSIGTFNFAEAELAIKEGYDKAQLFIDSIKIHVKREQTLDALKFKRATFRAKMLAPKFDEVEVIYLKGENLEFVQNSIIKSEGKNERIDFEEFTNRFFRVAAATQVKYIYPTLEKKDTTYKLKLDITKEKPFAVSAGGHFSSRPVNTGYLGFSYQSLSRGGLRVAGDAYFGKFYGSSRLKMDLDVPTSIPFRVSPYFLLNRWDYFRSFATFFEDVKPSFLVQNEMYYGVKFAMPIGNKYIGDADFRSFTTDDEYYQDLNFTNQDTSDLTNFEGESFILGIERNSLNRKQWASAGKYFRAQVRYVQGKERSVSGSTTQDEYDLRRMHEWVNISIEGQVFPISNSLISIGLYGKGVINSQSLFSNYTSTLLTMTEFTPIPDSKTLFLEHYRAPQYVGAGTNFIIKFKKLIDARVDAYFYQPFKSLERFNNGSFGYSDKISLGTYMLSSSLIFHSPIGPLRLTANYFPKESRPLMVQMSFGYVLFNDRAIR